MTRISALILALLCGCDSRPLKVESPTLFSQPSQGTYRIHCVCPNCMATVGFDIPMGMLVKDSCATERCSRCEQRLVLKNGHPTISQDAEGE